MKLFFKLLAMFIIVGTLMSCVNSKKENINGHDFVDLGLSVKWATCNLGASQPEDFGGHYSWGEISEKKEYTWQTYKWCKGSYNKLTKYIDDSSIGEIVDNFNVLELSDDAANANWGSSWRIPTADEWQELFTHCNVEFTTINGIDGVLFTSAVQGYTSKSIFLPAAGIKDESDWNTAIRGGYWSSSTHPDFNTSMASYLWFYSEKKDIGWTAESREKGLSIRPVAN